MENYHRNKRVLQFWSGGADSTYLLLQNLMAGNDLTLTYVDILNNKTKVDRERDARELLKNDIKVFCEHFNCAYPKFMRDHIIRVFGSTFESCNAPQAVIFAMFSLLVGKGYDEIQMGIVVGDSMRGKTLNQEFAEVFKSQFDTYFPKISYPIEDVSKEAIYLTLKGYDDVLGTNFLGHITVCENLYEPCGDKKECTPCQTQQKVFENLKWVSGTTPCETS